jgi:hypothetical protein
MGLKKAPGIEILNGWKEITNSRRGGRSLARSVDALVGNLPARLLKSSYRKTDSYNLCLRDLYDRIPR